MFADVRIRRSEEFVNRQETGHHHLARKVLEAIKYERDPEFVQIRQKPRPTSVLKAYRGMVPARIEFATAGPRALKRRAHSAKVCFDTPDGN